MITFVIALLSIVPISAELLRVMSAANSLIRYEKFLALVDSKSLESDLVAIELLATASPTSASKYAVQVLPMRQERLTELVELSRLSDRQEFATLASSARNLLLTLQEFGTGPANRTDEMRIANAEFLAAFSSANSALKLEQAVRTRQLSLAAALFAVALGAAIITGALLQRRASRVRIIRQWVEEQADLVSRTDALTGIGNGFEFETRLTDAISRNAQVSVLVVDVDRFGALNDRNGSSFGDIVLREIALRIRSFAARHNGMASRIAGDRFGVLLALDDGNMLEDACKDIISVCAEPLMKGRASIVPSVSIGAVDLANSSGGGAAGLDTIMRLTGVALVAAKSKSSQRFVIYENQLAEKFVDKSLIADELPRAMRDDRLEVFLQPRIKMSTRQIIGFEALVRFSYEGRYLPAREVVSAARAVGIDVEFDRYMIERSVSMMADWNRRRKTAFPVSVNLSGLHLEQDGGAEFIAEALARHNFPAELLTVEIAETMELKDRQRLSATLERLRETGCRISIDDFGAGQTSIGYLRALDADEIKVDGSLIAELDTCREARLVLEAILHLAKNLGLEVVIEGVERETQADILTEMGCEIAQGFLFGQPRPATDWLADVTYGPVAVTDAA